MAPEQSFDNLVADALSHPITGWDFSYVAGRYVSEDPPWVYENCVLPYVETASKMLDVDTGGGEVLLRLNKQARQWPAYCYAIEAYEPNMTVATKALASLGVHVAQYWPNQPLPFESANQTNGFDLIINRHGTLNAQEYARITKKGGYFITQQVGSEMNGALNRALGAPLGEYADLSLNKATQQLESAGYKIIAAQEVKPDIKFTDIGAIVWYLESVPWQIVGFTVEKYATQLQTLHKQILANGPFQSQGHAFYIEAELIK